MHTILLLHTNDIHGRLTGLARVATLVDRIKAAQAPTTSVVYVDGGDSEEASVRLSNITKGSAMHRVLSVAGCQAATVGNAAVMRYGPTVLAAQAANADYPLLLANVRDASGALLPGAQATALLQAGPIQLGLIGITAPMFGTYDQFFGLELLPSLPLVNDLAQELRQQGAHAVVLVSHLGMDDDRKLAADLEGVVDLIIGAHTHTLLPEGEWVGPILIAQAGCYAEHLGQVELTWDGTKVEVVGAQVIAVTDDLLLKPEVTATINALEAEAEASLQTVIADLPAPLDFDAMAECSIGTFLAEVLRTHMQAEIGLVAVSQAWTDGLPAGPLRRLTLYERSPSTANPGVVDLLGSQLEVMMRQGRDPVFAAETPRALRGSPRGLLQLSGAEWINDQLLINGKPIDPDRQYRVAASDWEIEHYGGYIDPVWQLQPVYDTVHILREIVEEYVTNHYPPTRA